MAGSAFLLPFQLHLNSCMDSLLRRTTSEIIGLVRSRFALLHEEIVSKTAENRRLSEKLRGLDTQPPSVALSVQVGEADRMGKSPGTDEERCYLLDLQTHLHTCMNCILKDIATEITAWVKENISRRQDEVQSASAKYPLQDKGLALETESCESASNNQPISYECQDVHSGNSHKGLAQDKAAVEMRQVPEAACFVVAEPSLDYELTVATTAIEEQPHDMRQEQTEEGQAGHCHPDHATWPDEVLEDSSVPPEGGTLEAVVPLQQVLRLGDGHADTGLHSCGQCGKSFGKEWVLRRHMRKHVEGHSAEAGAAGHDCPHCGRTFRQRKGLVSHLHSHSGEKPYACDVCDLHFTRPESVNKHRRLHSGVKPYACPQCPRRFFRSDGLKSHMQTHEGKRRPGRPPPPKLCMCAHCGKAFSSVSQVANHERTHTGERPYECPQCHKRFRHAGALSVHRVTHQRERPHACTQCPKAFRCAKHLKRHLVTHSDARPFSCDQCPLAFRTAAELKGHKARHGLQRTHGCPDCGKRFKTEYEVKLHRRAHNGERPYRCPDCERTFRRLHHLTSHRLTHSGEKPYACDVCQRRFIRAREMRSHRRRVHLAAEPSSCDQCQANFENLPLLEAHRRAVHCALEEQEVQGLARFPKILPRRITPAGQQGGKMNQVPHSGKASGGSLLGPVVFVLADQSVSLPVLQSAAVLTPVTAAVKLPPVPLAQTQMTAPLKVQLATAPKTPSGKVTAEAALTARDPITPPAECSAAELPASALPGMLTAAAAAKDPGKAVSKAGARPSSKPQV